LECGAIGGVNIITAPAPTTAFRWKKVLQ